MRGIWAILTRKQSSLGSAAFILMAMVMGSAILGLVRLRVLYDRFTPEETGVFFAAFRIPNLLFELLAMGALTSAFIPVYTKYLAKNKEKDAQVLASTVINIAVIIITILTIPISIWTEAISKLFAPGFTDTQIHQMAGFTRTMMILQVVPLIIGSFFTGILQSQRLFIIPALAPILYNIGMIVGILMFSSQFGLFAAVIGVGMGALMYVLIQLPLVIVSGYRHLFIAHMHHEGVKEIGTLVVPRMIGIGASQIDTTVDLMLSTLLGSKMVTVFFLAQSLQQLPVRLFGTAISQASLPTLSLASAEDNLERFKGSIVTAVHMMLFFVIPTSIFLVVLRIPVVRLIYGASLFDWEATVLTAVTLSFFCLSLFAQAASQILTRGFYALYDSKTPVTISIGTILLNTILSIVSIIYLKLPIWSLGVTTTIASTVNMLFLLVFLYRRIGGFSLGDMVIKPMKMFSIAFISGMMVYVLMKLFDQLVFDTTRVVGLVMLTVTSGGVGIATYFFLSWVIGIEEVETCMKLLDKIRRVRTLLIQPAEELVSSDVPQG